MPERVIELPVLIFREPVPLADTPPLAVFGFNANPAVFPLAVIFALMFTLLDAVSVRFVLAVQVRLALILIFPPVFKVSPVTEDVPKLL